MEVTESDYYRDAIAMAVCDALSYEQIWDCLVVSSNGEEFNQAVWATVRLNDLLGED